VLAKFAGRALALCLAVGIGLASAIVLSPVPERPVLAALVLPTLELGIAFLSIGVLVSSLAHRQITAASAAVAIWFLFVFFYDLGLLGLLVITDGQISQQLIATLVCANPAGLFRVQMMTRFAGPDVLGNLGMTAKLPTALGSASIWAAWIALPPLLSGVMLRFEKASR
jgi:Cu-processing system permease protein